MIHNTQFEAIGTHWSIDCELLGGELEAQQLFDRVTQRIAQFDQNYSRFREDSLVSRMAKSVGTYTVPDDAKPMLGLYIELYGLTGGAMTPLIGKTLEEAGYDATYSLVEHELHAPPKLEDTLVYDHPTLTLKKPALLDFGAAGKGYLVDIVAAMLRDGGATSGVVNAGGDIVTFGAEPVRVALEHPIDTTQAIGVATIANQSLCGSAGNRRAWGQYHHIINPHTLQSPQEILAVWVIADTALLADALTTCLYLCPVSAVASHFTFEYLILRSDFSVEQSAHFPAELFSR